MVQSMPFIVDLQKAIIKKFGKCACFSDPPRTSKSIFIGSNKTWIVPIIVFQKNQIIIYNHWGFFWGGGVEIIRYARSRTKKYCKNVCLYIHDCTSVNSVNFIRLRIFKKENAGHTCPSVLYNMHSMQEKKDCLIFIMTFVFVFCPLLDFCKRLA